MDMELGHATKRRRVCSLEPTKILHASFASKYVNNLVPALHNIKKQVSSDHEKDNCAKCTQIVRYEVDMALALSSEGFAWSHALKDKLQNCPNEGKIHLLRRKGSCIVEQHVNHHSLPVFHLQKPLVYTKFCPNHTSKPKNVKLIKSSKRVLLQRQEIKAAAKNSEEEEKQITQRLNNLRNLLPGGNGMGVDEMLKEMGSYLICLELQVNILRCLVETETH